MNQNVFKKFRNFCPEFQGPGELCQFESQDYEIGKLIKFKPFSIYTKNFKSISLIVIENLRSQKGLYKVRKWTLKKSWKSVEKSLRNRPDKFCGKK